MYSCLVSCLFYSLLHLSVGTHSSNDGKFPLHFAYITTKTGDFVASGGIPIVDMALQIINERDDILQNYTLNYTDILDSGVSVLYIGTTLSQKKKRITLTTNIYIYI